VARFRYFFSFSVGVRHHYITLYHKCCVILQCIVLHHFILYLHPSYHLVSAPVCNAQATGLVTWQLCSNFHVWHGLHMASCRRYI
jgi:hypothetical protein